MSQLSPCSGQTAENLTAWLKANITVGAMAAIRRSDTTGVSYLLATVTRVRKDRFELDRTGGGEGSAFFFNGNNCVDPDGQIRLVVPTFRVMAACGI